jgi:hypothetical protein
VGGVASLFKNSHIWYIIAAAFMKNNHCLRYFFMYAIVVAPATEVSTSLVGFNDLIITST